MSEVSVAEDALRNSDVIATEEGLIASSACGFSACINGTTNGLVSGDIEFFGTDGAVHVLVLSLITLDEKVFERESKSIFLKKNEKSK
jgi:hypothetical protein